MRFNQFVFFIFIATLVVVLTLAGTGCASIVPPSGGPRDTLPPVIVNVNPPDSTLNFDSKRIDLEFNEFVDLEDVYKNLIISPLPKTFPEVQRKYKTVSIRLKDSLEKNTTYVFNFANSIKDINEGNRAKDMIYLVSTGNYFDSLQLSGNIKIAKTAKPDSTLIVMLHTNLDDSAVVKERPRYITKVDSSGNFLFRFLAPGTYRLYALKDESSSYLYTSKQQIFAFADSAITLRSIPPEPIRLYAYAYDEEKKEDENEGTLNKKEKRITFQTNLDGDKQDLLKALIFTFPSPLKTFSPEKMALRKDSTYTPVTNNTFTLDSTRRILTMNMPWEEATAYHLILEKDFATDSLDRGLLKIDTLHFSTKARSDYGQAKITFLHLDLSLNPVLLFLQSDQVKDAFPLTSDVLDISLYAPGDYDLQILYDKNKNGKWDPGDFFGGHLQPEMVVPLSRKLTIKANWTVEPEINMEKPQTTGQRP